MVVVEVVVDRVDVVMMMMMSLQSTIEAW